MMCGYCKLCAIASYGHPRCTIPHFAYLLVCRPFRPRLLYLQLFRFRVAVAAVVAAEDCNTEEADVELLTMMCLEHAVMSAARSVETLFEAHNLTKQSVHRQQGCLQCCRASCRLGVESTAEVLHKSTVATRCGVHSRGTTQEHGCDSVCLRTKGKDRNMSFITDRLPESGLLR